MWFSIRRTLLPAVCALFFSGTPSLQEGKRDEEFAKRVDKAVERGTRYLLAQYRRKSTPKQRLELILLAMLHGGASPKHPVVVRDMNRMLRATHQEVYSTSFRILVLEKLGRQRFQFAVAEMAQFLVTAQAKNGQWDYGGPRLRPTRRQYRPGKGKPSNEPGPRIRLAPQKGKTRTPHGNNSTTHAAALGLHAAQFCRVSVPKSTWKRMEKWLRENQNLDGGWGYNPSERLVRVASQTSSLSTGSMTVSCLASLILCRQYLGGDWKSDPAVKKGFKWIELFLDFSENPGGSYVWHFYYLYGLERLGTISGIKKLDGIDWYRKGAEWLLERQQKDGRWKASRTYCDDATNTSFAILFLRRATPGVPTPKRVKGKPNPLATETRPGKKPSPMELLKGMRRRLGTAKSLRIKFRIEIHVGDRRTGRLQGEFVRADGNRTYLRLEGSLSGKPYKSETFSDGKMVRSYLNSETLVLEGKTPSDWGDRVIGALVRAGIYHGLPIVEESVGETATGSDPFAMDRVVLRPARKIAGRLTRPVEYHIGNEKGADCILDLDPKSMLPVRRILTLDRPQGRVEIREMYDDIELDAKVDPARFRR